jgi:hypothetical protein
MEKCAIRQVFIFGQFESKLSSYSFYFSHSFVIRSYARCLCESCMLREYFLLLLCSEIRQYGVVAFLTKLCRVECPK